ncbi:MAG: nucleotidyltransferase family protein [Candidatus Thorarchaeota archaeon]|nr:nucleotidyltransferase family protein [Candidatus Thorarchaeota archaeon]
MLTKAAILKMIETNMDPIRKFGVRKIGVFGSYVRGEQQERSDIDVLVQFEKGMKSFDNYMELKFFLEDLFGYKVDLVLEEALKPELRPHILRSVEYAMCV